MEATFTKTCFFPGAVKSFCEAAKLMFQFIFQTIRLQFFARCANFHPAVVFTARSAAAFKWHQSNQILIVLKQFDSSHSLSLSSRLSPFSFSLFLCLSLSLMYMSLSFSAFLQVLCLSLSYSFITFYSLTYVM